MPKFTQNLVVLIDPSKNAYNISSKGANMYLNRFCIDEDAGFECSGVLYLKKSSFIVIVIFILPQNLEVFNNKGIYTGDLMYILQRAEKKP